MSPLFKPIIELDTDRFPTDPLFGACVGPEEAPATWRLFPVGQDEDSIDVNATTVRRRQQHTRSHSRTNPLRDRTHPALSFTPFLAARHSMTVRSARSPSILESLRASRAASVPDSGNDFEARTPRKRVHNEKRNACQRVATGREPDCNH